MNSTITRSFRAYLLPVLISLLLATGLILAILSWGDICTSACAEGHKYRLFGFRFEPIGILFFVTASTLYLLSMKNSSWQLFFHVTVAGGLGAEGYFLYLQKYVIGKWCPICVSIFACIAALTLVLIYQYSRQLHEQRSHHMTKALRNAIGSLAFLTLGFFVAVAGVAKAENSFVHPAAGKDNPAFGKADSVIDVYVFTDWFCPACRTAEPSLEKQFPGIMKKARLIFVDTVIHEESMNFVPYNLSFMVKEKEKYFTLRKKLAKLALTDQEPTEEKIEALAQSVGVKYHELPYSEVQQGIKYFEKIKENYGIESTPAVVIVNTKTNKGKKLTKMSEITEADIPALIDKLSK